MVDQGITSPYYFDFFLLSHTVPGSSGTAKPAHYIVLENGMGFSAEVIQDLTYHLCFLYGKCNCSVSYVPAAYFADRLCERGRHYLKEFNERCQLDPTFRNMTEPQLFDQARLMFYRGGGRDLQPGVPANPWHKNLDGKMFWM